MNSCITYKNNNINFSIEGKGAAVVLLHGFLEDISMWKNITQELKKNYKIITIDLLGHGKTDCLGYVHAMETMADVVKEVLKSQRIRKVTLIGHSMGGYVGLAFAEKYVENVKGLCLMNSTAQADTEERKELRLRAIQMAHKNYEAMVTMSVNNLFTQTIRPAIVQEIEMSKKVALNTSVQSYIACVEGMRIRKNKEVVLKSATFKKMIIVGEKDPVLNYESILKEAKRTETRVVSFPNGHMSHIENPKELLSTIKSFLKEK